MNDPTRAHTLVAEAIVARAMRDVVKLGLPIADIGAIVSRSLETIEPTVWVTVIVTPKEE